MKLRLFFGDGDATAVADVEAAVLTAVVDDSEKYLKEMRGDDLRRKEFFGGNVFDAEMFMFCGRVADFSLIGVVWKDRSTMLERLADLLSAFLGVDVFAASAGLSPSFGVSSMWTLVKTTPYLRLFGLR